MDAKLFDNFFTSYTSFEFTRNWIEIGLNASDFCAYCFKHKLLNSSYLQTMIDLAIKEGATLYLDQGKLYLHHRKGKESFPKEGTCTEACLQLINCLKETGERSMQ